MRNVYFTKSQEVVLFVCWLVILFAASGCASRQVSLATKYNSPVMRVAIDADSIDRDQYARLQTALIQSNKFIVVDRGNGFRAVQKEQSMLHEDQPERFSNREKYARWGKLYGVGGVITVNVQCERRSAFTSGYYNRCLQNISLIDATSGEVLASVEQYQDSESGWNAIPAWTDTVNAFNKSIPAKFGHNEEAELVAYKDAIEKENNDK